MSKANTPVNKQINTQVAQANQTEKMRDQERLRGKSRKKSSARPCAVLAAGGSGGHMFPAEALSGALQARGYRIVLVTDPRGQSFGQKEAEKDHPVPALTVRRIPSCQLGRGVIGKMRTVVNLWRAQRQAKHILKQEQADIVIGFGGYASLPTVYAAARRKLPVILHEQNALAGRANRWLAPWAVRIASSFLKTTGFRPQDSQKITYIGNPVRQQVQDLRPIQPPTLPENAGESWNILVFGGSQGAHVFSEMVPAALRLLSADLRKRVRIVQQVRAEDMDAVKAQYQADGVTAELAPFFTDLPQKMQQADLVIARAGASTISELNSLGKAAIFIPYPWARDDHQTINAQMMVEVGAGWLQPQDGLTPRDLAGCMQALLTQPKNLFDAHQSSYQCGRPHAARDLAALVDEVRSALPDAADSYQYSKKG